MVTSSYIEDYIMIYINDVANASRSRASARASRTAETEPAFRRTATGDVTEDLTRRACVRCDGGGKKERPAHLGADRRRAAAAQRVKQQSGLLRKIACARGEMRASGRLLRFGSARSCV